MKKTIAIAIASVATTLLAGCGNNPPVPDWQMNAHSSIERATSAYMSGNSRVEAAEAKRAREALASTGKIDLIIRAELVQCAARVASLVFEDCAGYDKLAQDAGPTDRAYAAYLAGRATTTDTPLLPTQHQPIAAITASTAAAADAGAVQAIADPLSRLVASGVLLRAGKASPLLLADAVETASAQGWRRPLLAWLGVQAMRAEQAGDSAEAQRIKRRIDIVAGKHAEIKTLK
ncbi:hypothetical protein [Duganella sp. BuS-21]|uniref:hypothetical protein n=1 Tax=Duganella sp. BuS-21 TaxID=2943848 RepID=UPI0035A5A380